MRKETRNRHRCQSTAGAVALGTKLKARRIRTMVVMWCLWWITEVRRLWCRLVVTRLVPGRADVWCPSRDSREDGGGRIEVGQTKLCQFSPRLQLDLRWAWDPGVGVGILWVCVSLCGRTVWIRRSSQVTKNAEC